MKVLCALCKKPIRGSLIKHYQDQHSVAWQKWLKSGMKKPIDNKRT